MIPGELFIQPGDVTLNAGRKTVTLTVANTGDRPIQVGSHYHFFETNPALKFDRKKARGFRLDIPALRDHPAGFAGAIAHATLLYVGSDAAERLAILRDLIEESGVRGGATCVGGVLLARLLAKEPAPLRRAVAHLWTALRKAAAGLPPVVPRVWQV